MSSGFRLEASRLPVETHRLIVKADHQLVELAVDAFLDAVDLAFHRAHSKATIFLFCLLGYGGANAPATRQSA